MKVVLIYFWFINIYVTLDRKDYAAILPLIFNVNLLMFLPQHCPYTTVLFFWDSVYNLFFYQRYYIRVVLGGSVKYKTSCCLLYDVSVSEKINELSVLTTFVVYTDGKTNNVSERLTMRREVPRLGQTTRRRIPAEYRHIRNKHTHTRIRTSTLVYAAKEAI